MIRRRKVKTLLRGLILLICLSSSVIQAELSVLQPKGVATIPGESCQIDARSSWTDQEKWVWRKICTGEVADFNNNTNIGYDSKSDLKDPDTWSSKRILRESFLETILLVEPYRGAIPRQGVAIVGAWFKDDLDFSNAHLSNLLILVQSRFDSDVNFTRLKSSKLISLHGSKFSGTVNMKNIEIEGDLLMRGRAEFGEVNLNNAKVGGNIELDGSKFTGMVNMINAEIGGNLFMRGGAEFAGINISGTKVAGQIDMTGSKFGGKIKMIKLEVKRNLFMKGVAKIIEVNLNGANIGGNLRLEGAEFGEVKLNGAKVDGNVELNGKKFSGMFSMRQSEVKGYLFMRGEKEFSREVNLQNSKIGGNIELDGSKYNGDVNMSGIEIDGNLFMRDGAEFNHEVDLLGAKVKGQIIMMSSKFGGKVTMSSIEVQRDLFMRGGAEFGNVKLDNAQVGGSLELNGSKFTGTLDMENIKVKNSLHMRSAEFGEVNLNHAKVGGNIELDGSKFTGMVNMSNLGIKANLFMRSAEFGSPVRIMFAEVTRVLDITHSLFSSLDLTGTLIGGDLNLGADRRFPTRWTKNSKLILRNTKVGTVQDRENAWPDKMDLTGFTYFSLGGLTADESSNISKRTTKWIIEEWLDKQIQYSPQPYEQLAKILNEMGYKEKATDILYENKMKELKLSYGLTLIRMNIYHLVIGFGYRTYYSIIWIVLFTLLGAFVLKSSGQGSANNMPYGISYSFDMLLPIIKLNERHYKVELKEFPKYYFYLHKLVGYFLAFMIVAGLSGLVK